jgi:hypothetical protein
VAFLTTLGITDQIDFVVDINPHKHGKFMPGTAHQIIPPQALRDYPPDYVIVMNPIYCPEIARDLHKLGSKAQLLPVV